MKVELTTKIGRLNKGTVGEVPDDQAEKYGIGKNYISPKALNVIIKDNTYEIMNGLLKEVK
ncbi:MAG: hypothetical protein ACFFDN_09260 [Candidatus Hodarchaeota archaeon]